MAEYFNRNKCLPSKVFLYRDGVGEGQIPVVFNLEVQQVLHTLKEAAIHYDQCVYLCCYNFLFLFRPVPVLTFIIVNKSINHRFYLEEGRGNYINPKPGTVVDTIVTRQERCVTFFCFLILLFAVMISS